MKGYLKFVDMLGLTSGVVFYDKLADQLIEHEGFKTELYYDHLGNPTIGVGHLLTEPMSETTIGLMLLEDIKRAEVDLDAVLPKWREFQEARRLALLDMMFNLGKPRFCKFVNMIQAIKAGDWKEASNQAIRSKWRRQVGKRAVRIARMLRDGDSLQAD